MQSSFNTNFVRSVKPQRELTEEQLKKQDLKQAKRQREAQRQREALQHQQRNEFVNSHI